MKNNKIGCVYSSHKAGIFTLVIFAFLLLSSACAAPTPQITVTPYWSDVDPVFRTFYDHLGGPETLGPVISLPMQEGHMTVQYTEAAKMVFDPQAPAVGKFYLSPLGVNMGVAEPDVPTPSKSDLHYDGHIIHPDFWNMYERLGAHNVGKALSELHYNPTRKRHEQYFEKLGFYRIEGTNEICLLAYGVWGCGAKCKPTKRSEVAIIDVYRNVDTAFQGHISWLRPDLIGFALSEAYINAEGALEQIFENAVLVSNENQEPTGVSLRPLPLEFNLPVDSPRANSGNKNAYFYSVDGELGYEIPEIIWNYILNHGGQQAFGPPITHFSLVDARSYQQCFANICLTYVPNEVESLRVRPISLGYVYKMLRYTPPDVAEVEQVVAVATPVPLKSVTTIKAWESYPNVSSSQQQEVGIIVLGNFVPVEGIIAELLLFIPDSDFQSIQFPPTDARGQAYVSLPPIPASNGTLIEYNVCIQQPSGNKFCIGESFIIWNNP